MSAKHDSNNELKVVEEEEDDDKIHVNYLKIPIHTSHVKPGNTLATNDDILVLQDGSTTIEIRAPPKFEPKKMPWRNGLIRDIVWWPELNVFVLLTQHSVFTFNPQSLTTHPTTKTNSDSQLKIVAYSKIKPFEDKHSFWRCACVGTTLYISYSGFGTIIDEYNIRPSSCELINRWTPPKTCAIYEGIWCLRHQPNSDQLGMTIMDGRNNQWRFEIRSTKKLALVWQTPLPLTHGDCELSALPDDEWLAINSCGIRIIQIAQHKLKAAVEYERELKNIISIGKDYFVVRTKSTIEIHVIKRKETTSKSIE